MHLPLVSILTPAYNSEQFISETLSSVLDQTYPNWELLVVDDASTDNTAVIVRSFSEQDGRIKLFQLKTNSGTGIARNYALEQAQGDYIAFLDSDDRWKPEKLQKQLDFMQEHKLPFSFSFYECINEAGELLNRRVEAPRNLTYTQLFFCNYVGNLTGMYKVAHFGKIVNHSTRKRQDWMQWLTILKKMKQAPIVPESLAYYRLRENSISASKFDLVKYNFAVYREFHQFNVVKASICMIGFLFTQLLIKPRYIKSIKA